MMFPDCTLQEWINKHPKLKVYVDSCPRCRQRLETTRPFIEQDWIGLVSGECSCGYEGISTQIPKSSKSKYLLSKIRIKDD